MEDLDSKNYTVSMREINKITNNQRDELNKSMKKNRFEGLTLLFLRIIKVRMITL